MLALGDDLADAVEAGAHREHVGGGGPFSVCPAVVCVAARRWRMAR